MASIEVTDRSELSSDLTGKLGHFPPFDKVVTIGGDHSAPGDLFVLEEGYARLAFARDIDLDGALLVFRGHLRVAGAIDIGEDNSWPSWYVVGDLDADRVHVRDEVAHVGGKATIRVSLAVDEHGAFDADGGVSATSGEAAREPDIHALAIWKKVKKLAPRVKKLLHEVEIDSLFGDEPPAVFEHDGDVVTALRSVYAQGHGVFVIDGSLTADGPLTLTCSDAYTVLLITGDLRAKSLAVAWDMWLVVAGATSIAELLYIDTSDAGGVHLQGSVAAKWLVDASDAAIFGADSPERAEYRYAKPFLDSLPAKERAGVGESRGADVSFVTKALARGIQVFEPKPDATGTDGLAETGVAAELRKYKGTMHGDAGKQLLAKLEALPTGAEKTAAMRVYFELAPKAMGGDPLFTAAARQRALDWLDKENDPSFVPLLAAWGSSLERGLLLVRFAPERAPEWLKVNRDGDLAALVQLGSAEALDRAREQFAKYEKLSIVKPGDSGAIGLAAVALTMSKDSADWARVEPFAKGEKVAGAIAKADAARAMAHLERARSTPLAQPR